MTDPNITHSSTSAGWPIERIVPALAAGVTATGLTLGELHAPRWRLLSAFAAANLALYAAVGWCPASALLTRAGVPSLRHPPKRIGTQLPQFDERKEFSTMTIALSTTLTDTDFETAVTATKAALSEQGFGVLTEIDMQATLKAKLGTDMEKYLILGACNPTLAHRAVGIVREIGLLLPCNVVVRADTTAGSVIVEAMNPDLMVQVTGEPALSDVAAEATTKLQAALDTLGSRDAVRS